MAAQQQRSSSSRKGAKRASSNGHAEHKAEQWLQDQSKAAGKLLEAGREEVERALQRVTDGYEQLSGELVRQSEKARKQTQKGAEKLIKDVKKSTAAKKITALPNYVAESVDVALGRVGLMRVARHEEELAKVKARFQKKTAKPKKSKMLALSQ